MSTVVAPGFQAPQTLRSFARAFAQFENFDRFVAALEGSLAKAAGGGTVRIALEDLAREEGERFLPHTLNLPLASAEGSLGALQVGGGGERRSFGADDLHLLAGLADFAGAALAQARRARDAGRARALLRLLLDQAPVGIAAFGEDGRVIAANGLAERWLGATPPNEILAADGRRFHLRSEGRLILGESRRIASPDGDETRVVVLHDLSPEQGRLMDGLRRELYRAQARGTPFAIALIELPEGQPGALDKLASLRATLAEGELAGPYDATRAGLVLGVGGPALRARLRRLRAVVADAGARLGLAELGRDGKEPEELLKAALESGSSFEEALRPTLLVHGETPAVAEALALATGRAVNVVRSESEAHARELLRARVFDGILTELDGWRAAEGGAAVLRLARELQPGIRTFHTTVHAATEGGAEPNAIVIEKPFEAAVVGALLRERLAG